MRRALASRVFALRVFLPWALAGGGTVSVTPGPSLCVERASVYAPGLEAVGVRRGGEGVQAVYAPGFEAVQVGCCR